MAKGSLNPLDLETSGWVLACIMGTRLSSELECTQERTLGLGGILVCTHGLEVNLEVTHRYEWALRLIQGLEWAPM